MSLVDDLLSWGMTLLFGGIVVSVFLEDVFGALGPGGSFAFVLAVLGMIYIGVI